MVRLGVFLLIALSLFLMFGCKSTEVQETGLELSFSHCLEFDAWVWVDNKYVGSYSSEIASFVEIGAGGHSLYAKSNMIAGDTCVCWTQNFTVASGKTTFLTLDCTGAGCCKPTSTASLK